MTQPINSGQHSTILVLAAMNEEMNALLHCLREDGHREPDVIDSESKHIGKLFVASANGVKVLLSESGMGGVHAALKLAFIADRYPLDAVLLLGVGGALRSNLEIGDLVLSTEVIQHDSFSSLDVGHYRMCPGELVLSQDDAKRVRTSFLADEKLLQWAKKTVKQLPIKTGVMMSGGEFVGTVDRKQAIAALHPRALLVDMEAAGVAQVAYRLGLPFLVAKTVADRLCPEGGIEADFKKCLDSAAKNAGQVLTGILRDWP